MKVHQLTKEELRLVQLTQLEMLKEVDRICTLCGIQYNIIAGTLLGAVRHKGYIPWDDDADIALLREEYEKFRNACETELDQDRFYFQDHRNTPGYRWGYGKLRRRGTKFLREYQEQMPYEQGIFIDIFPLDPVSDIKLVRLLQNIHYFCLRKVMWAPVGKQASQWWLFRKWYALLNGIPDPLLYKHYDKMVEKGKTQQTDWVRILTFPTPNKEYGYLKKWYLNSSRIEFEQEMFWGIQDFDAYLSFKFGDYMKMPAEEQRKVHPVTGLQCINLKLTNEKMAHETEKVGGQ